MSSLLGTHQSFIKYQGFSFNNQNTACPSEDFSSQHLNIIPESKPENNHSNMKHETWPRVQLSTLTNLTTFSSRALQHLTQEQCPLAITGLFNKRLDAVWSSQNEGSYDPAPGPWLPRPGRGSEGRPPDVGAWTNRGRQEEKTGVGLSFKVPGCLYWGPSQEVKSVRRYELSHRKQVNQSKIRNKL